ncbi:39S ribosomal protein L48, mitochondrial [Sparganum proliferum]
MMPVIKTGPTPPPDHSTPNVGVAAASPTDRFVRAIISGRTCPMNLPDRVDLLCNAGPISCITHCLLTGSVLCLKGYDFPVLERYERYARSALKKWTETVSSFPLPPEKTLYKTYHPNSTKIDGIKSVDLPIIVELLQQNLPEGVEMILQERDPQLEESRYVANLEMETLQSELEKLTK